MRPGGQKSARGRDRARNRSQRDGAAAGVRVLRAIRGQRRVVPSRCHANGRGGIVAPMQARMPWWAATRAMPQLPTDRVESGLDRLQALGQQVRVGRLVELQ